MEVIKQDGNAKGAATFLTEASLAERWLMSRRTLQRWRSGGIGPRFLKLYGSIRYPLEDVHAFEAQMGRGRGPRS